MINPIPKDLMDILACPVCKGDLTFKEAKNSLFCGKCDFDYPIKDGIPVLLPPEQQG